MVTPQWHQTAPLSTYHFCICTSSAVIELQVFPLSLEHLGNSLHCLSRKQNAQATLKWVSTELFTTSKSITTAFHSPGKCLHVLASVASSQVEQARSAGIHQPTNPQCIQYCDKMNTSWLLPTAKVIVMSLLFSANDRWISVCSINHSSSFSLLKLMQFTLPGMKPAKLICQILALLFCHKL